MKKIDPTIVKETLYISAWVLILSVLMQAVFLIIQKWDYTVLLGNLLTGVVVIINFFLMGLGVQMSLNKEEKEAKKVIKLSQLYRYLLLIVVLVIGVVFSCFNTWTVLIPVIFPRIAVAIRPIFNKKSESIVASNEAVVVEEKSEVESNVTNQESDQETESD